MVEVPVEMVGIGDAQLIERAQAIEAEHGLFVLEVTIDDVTCLALVEEGGFIRCHVAEEPSDDAEGWLRRLLAWWDELAAMPKLLN